VKPSGTQESRALAWRKKDAKRNHQRQRFASSCKRSALKNTQVLHLGRHEETNAQAPPVKAIYQEKTAAVIINNTTPSS